ncbi:MAG: PEP-CTERM sorting domain-containing protein [Goleter apudmare HA4340-LM2]|jgi:hypothetical protein|nr:PEP-CTERM sorting domain-containing protein [Goleter apudmare HA4340-LM2]
MTTKVFNALAAATTLVGIVATAGAANAASLSFNTSLASQKTDILNAPLSVQKFNSSLGTLDSVILEFTSNILGNGSVTNTGSSAANFRLSLNSDISLKDATNNNTLFNLNASTLSSQFSVGANQTLSTPTLTATETDTQTFTDAGFLQSFIGTGNRNFLFSAEALSGIVGSGNLNSTVSTFADGFLKVTYNYTEKTTSVPEPSALLGIGVMTGFGVISKKKKWLKMANS